MQGAHVHRRQPAARKKRKLEKADKPAAQAAEEQEAYGLQAYERSARRQAPLQPQRTQAAALPIKTPDGQLKLLRQAALEQVRSSCILRILRTCSIYLHNCCMLAGVCCTCSSNVQH